MSPKHLSGPLMAGLVIGAAAILAGCATATPEETPPAVIKPVAGSQIPQLQLTEHAAQRLGIVTQPVRPTGAAGQPAHEVIPYSAVVYDHDGSTWTYVNTAARTYEREPIMVTDIDGQVALLAAGPAAGTPVVTVGAAELLGTEYNISGEE
jgi:hypothetical protein